MQQYQVFWLPSQRAEPRVLRLLTAELLGTFAFTGAATGSQILIRGSQSTDLAKALVPSLVVIAVIAAFGPVSGAHINPIVTAVFALCRGFPWRWVSGYWVAQLLGAILAATVLRLILGPMVARCLTTPHDGVVAALVLEGVLTSLLVTVILATTSQAKVVGFNAALPVAAMIAGASLFARPISGASMNPARLLGPAIIAGALADSWVYVLGPALGGGLGILFDWILYGSQQPGEAGARRDDVRG